MYEFTDVTENREGVLLPSEALRLNGEYLENLISGYRTLYVSGRELLDSEPDSIETGNADGSRYLKKRYPSRTITVGYQLLAESNEEFRKAYNQLNELLDTEEAELVFADEPDKFFTGTPSSASQVETGRNAVTGEIEFFCADPFKYSLEEYEALPTLDDGMGFLIDYKGTYKAFPTLEADFYSEEELAGDAETGDEETEDETEISNELTGSGDCGYVAFFNENGKIIQLGDPEETDFATYKKAQTLVNPNFQKASSWGSVARARWKRNVGVTGPDAVTQTGTLGVAHSYNTTAAGTYYLKADSYGSGSKYHGPSITRTLPADKAGHKGAANFKLTYKQKMCIGNGKNDSRQKGGLQVLLVSGSGAARRVVAGVWIYKGNEGKKAKVRFYVNHKKKNEITIDLSYHNRYFGASRAADKKKKLKKITSVKTSSIVKSGGTINFNIGGKRWKYTDEALKNVEVTQVTFQFAKYADRPALSYNGLYWAKFVKNNCDTWKDVPNKFTANDVVVADCKDGEIYLNDNPAPELGALGNDWEEFCLEPGQNQIGTAYSEWVEDAYAPQFKIRYREVFL